MGSWFTSRCYSAGAVWTAPSREKKENSWAGGSCIVNFCRLKVFRSAQDMDREVVKTDSATTRIPELDFEIPAFSQKGGIFKNRVFVLFMPGLNLTVLQKSWCQA